MTYNIRLVSILYTLLVSSVILSTSLPATADDGNNTAKVNRDVSKAIGTLDNMQKLGREINRDHKAQLAKSERQSVRTSRARVRTASQTDASAAAKRTAKKANGASRPSKKKKSVQ